MSAATRNDASSGPRTVRFGRRSSRGLLLDLSAPRVAVLGAAFVIGLSALYVGGVETAAWAAALWLPLLASAYARVGGQTVVEWLPVAGHWALRRARGQTAYGVKVLRPRPAGTLALPGDAASLRVHDDAATGAAMVHDPHARTLTVVATVRHPAFVLLGPGEQERRVSGWARVYATACQSGRISRIQVLERAQPDAGESVVRHWAEHGIRDDSWPARNYGELVATAGPTAEHHETTISISLDTAKARRAIRHEGGGVAGAAAVLRQEMTTLAAALRAADIIDVTWVDSEQLALLLRAAYDPVHALTRESAHIPQAVATAGPIAVHEEWDHLRTDTGWHAVYWVSEWPRAEVFPTFLAPVILTAGVARAVSIIAQPLTPFEALRAIRRDRVEYQTDAAQRQRMGQLNDLAAEQEWAEVTQRERDLIEGHGDLRYAGFLTVTAPDSDSLQVARATIEQAASQAGCETRLLVGQQAQAFAAAALPLGRGI